MAEMSREVVVLLESTKIGRRIPNLELPWDVINVMVTDDNISSQAVETISAHGVKVILAPYAN